MEEYLVFNILNLNIYNCVILNGFDIKYKLD